MPDGIGLIQYIAAFVGGVLSFLSPCVFPVVPVYLSLISGLSYEELQGGAADASAEDAAPKKQPGRWRLLGGALAFVIGFGLVTVLIFGIFKQASNLPAGWVRGIQLTAAALMVVFALQMFGLFRIDALFRERRFHMAENKLGLLGALLIGAAFALGWMPCTGPILGGILSMSLGTARMGLAVVYVFGMALPFLLAALFAGHFLASLRKVARHMRTVEIASGVLLLIMAALLVLGSQEQIAKLASNTGWGDVSYKIEEWVSQLFHRK
jgi:cytochrome c-type biogenesis protein